MVLRRWLLDGGYPCDRCFRYASGFKADQSSAVKNAIAHLVTVHVELAHGMRGLRRLQSTQHIAKED